MESVAGNSVLGYAYMGTHKYVVVYERSGYAIDPIALHAKLPKVS